MASTSAVTSCRVRAASSRSWTIASTSDCCALAGAERTPELPAALSAAPEDAVEASRAGLLLTAATAAWLAVATSFMRRFHEPDDVPGRGAGAGSRAPAPRSAAVFNTKGERPICVFSVDCATRCVEESAAELSGSAVGSGSAPAAFAGSGGVLLRIGSAPLTARRAPDAPAAGDRAAPDEARSPADRLTDAAAIVAGLGGFTRGKPRRVRTVCVNSDEPLPPGLALESDDFGSVFAISRPGGCGLR